LHILAIETEIDGELVAQGVNAGRAVVPV